MDTFGTGYSSKLEKSTPTLSPSNVHSNRELDSVNLVNIDSIITNTETIKKPEYFIKKPKQIQ